MRNDKLKLKRALETEEGVIKVRGQSEEPFVLTMGNKTRFFLDIKLALVNPEILKLMTEVVLTDTGYFAREGNNKLMNKYGFDKIAAVAVGAIPLGTALAIETGLPLIIVRSTKFELESPSPEHTTGTNKNVIGNCKGKTVLILDDVSSTGNSVITAARQIRAEGGLCEYGLVIVDRDEGAMKLCHQNKIELKSLFRRKDLL